LFEQKRHHGGGEGITGVLQGKNRKIPEKKKGSRRGGRGTTMEKREKKGVLHPGRKQTAQPKFFRGGKKKTGKKALEKTLSEVRPSFRKPS